MKTFVQDADYNGKTLIGNMTGSNGHLLARIAVVRNEVGSTYGIAHVQRLGAVRLDQLHLHAACTAPARWRR